MTSDTGLRARIAVAGAAIALAGCTSTIDPASTSGPAAITPDEPGLEVTIEHVPDGDSFRASSPTEGDLEIRLLGINTPEGDECLGEQARDRLRELLASGTATLTPWPAERDDFGRRLGFLVADDVFVNLAMIDEGLAVARAQSDHGFDREFEAAEATAAEERRGIWAPDACGPATDAMLEISFLNADAPGDDRANPNGEWAEIRNQGDGAVSLAGWGLRDESTRHRYDFVDVDLQPGERARVYTGCGDDDLDDDPIELYWCDPEPPVWNNSGDTAFLLDPNGGTASYFRHKR